MKYRDIPLVVKPYLDRQGKSGNKQIIFKNNLPWNEWVWLFLKRNKTLSLRFDEHIKQVRGAVSKPILNEHFENLISYKKYPSK